MRTACLLFAILMSFAVCGQKKSRLQQLSIEEGLSQNTVNTIFQDSKGFMWFGTQNGLNRYDAISFSVYKNNSDDSTTIGSSDVYAVYEDRKHNVWFGTRSGLSRFNREQNNFSNFEDLTQNQYAMRPAWCIVGSERDDDLWIGASGGLFRFDVETEKFSHYKINDSIQNANSIRAMCEDNRGKLWICPTVGNLKTFDKVTGTFNNVRSPLSPLLNDITCMLEDSDGYIWLGKDDGSLFQYNHKEDKFRAYVNLKDKFPIRALQEDREGQLWVGTDKGGVFLLSKDTGKLSSLGEKQQNGTDVVLSLYNDAKGDMWLGTYHGGVYLFDKIDTTFNHYAPYPEIKHADESNSVLAILQQGDDLWLGTDGGGLTRRTKKGEQYYRKGGGNHVAGNTILSLAKGQSDQLFIGTYADGLSVLDTRSEKFMTYNQANGLNDNSVWAICPDGDQVWIGTNRGGLNLLDTRTQRFRYFTNSLKDEKSISSNTIRSIFKDSRNKLWIGTVSGLNVFNDADSSFTSFFHRGNTNTLSNNNVLCIFEDTHKNMWFGTHGGGINRYDHRTDNFTSFEEKDGLAGNIVYGILEDSQGNLWLSTNKGISKFNIERKEFKNFDTRSGLSSSQFNTGAYWKQADGRMYFGNIEGVVSFYPHYIRENSFVPPVVITDFHLFNKPVPIGPNSPLTKSIGETSALELDHTQSVFSLQFAALNYSHSDKNMYQYQLEPFDKEWIQAGHNTTATYTNLDPGTYLFKVKGSNNDGVWNENFTSLKIIITPPFWKTIWFNLAVFALIMLTLYVAYRGNVSMMKEQKQVLTMLVTERTREIEEKNYQLLETEKKNAQLINQQLSDELASKSKELTNYALLIIQKNRLLEELKAKLKEALRSPASSNLRDFKNLLQLINYNFSPEKEWKEFNANFNRIHKGFSDTLKAKFPDLTHNDLRLCALYRIDIPTKDIAEAMGISQTSVKMARYRLRKKLALTPEEDIHQFLQRIEDRRA